MSEIQKAAADSAMVFGDPRKKQLEEVYIRTTVLENSKRWIEKEIKSIEETSERVTTRYLYLLLLLSAIQWVVFYYCIFHVEWLGWDIMEPLTYSVQIFSVLVAMKFYKKFRVDREPSSLLEVTKKWYFTRNPMIRIKYQN